MAGSDPREENGSGAARNRPREDEEQDALEALLMQRPADLPPVPELPQPPELKPNLPRRDAGKKREQELRDYQQMGVAYTLPAMLVAPILVLTLGGYWLDGRYHTSPDFTLGGAVLGAVVGFINLIRTANKLNK